MDKPQGVGRKYQKAAKKIVARQGDGDGAKMAFEDIGKPQGDEQKEKDQAQEKPR